MAGALKQEIAARTAAHSNDNEPVTERVTLAVSEMHCGACIHEVENALSAIDGVSNARANLSLRRVLVSFDPHRVGLDQLIDALAGAGFTAAELAPGPNADAEAHDGDLLRRLGVAGFAAMNIMLLSVSVWAGKSGEMDASVETLFHWISALIALPAVVYAGQPFFKSAGGALSARRLNMDVPISLGVILATAMSLFQTTRGSEQVYFDAAVTLLAFLLAGRYLDQRTRTRAAGAAGNLIGLRTMTASVIGTDGAIERRPARSLVPGMKILSAAGERIAADGVVLEEESDVDESLITGETLPRRVAPGEPVYAGTVNLTGPLVIEAAATDEGTVLAEIGRLMLSAEQGRGKYVRLADQAARLYAPAVHVLGLSTFIGWMMAGAGWEAALTAAIAVLIITCPCALALAVPVVQVVASSRLFSRGIILKAADGLERLAEIDWVVLDKTGTLTMGEPVLIGLQESSALAAAAALGSASRHPYSRALVRAASERGIAIVPAQGVCEVPGAGLVRTTGDGEVRLGSALWCGLDQGESRPDEVWLKTPGKAPVAFRFSDALRPDAVSVVSRLDAGGYALEVLSGDRSEAVERVAHDAGIRVWRGGRKPDEKIARLAALKASGRRVLMVGDGLNDAPALAAAHASLSPSSAADISQTAADAVFQGHRLEPIVEALAVARAARRMSLENFAIAIVYNVFFVPLAMAGLVTPLIAAVAMSLSSITVTANALRLKTKKLELGS